MSGKKPVRASSERGNALVMGLIAATLFAILAYVVVQTGRGRGDAEREGAAIAANAVTQYAASLRTAVIRMTMSGIPANAIIFNSPGTGLKNEIFDAAGGGITASSSAPAGAGNITQGGLDGLANNQWGYKDVTTKAGYYVKGIGTDAAVTGMEGLAYLHGVSTPVCQQILKGLGLNPAIAKNTSIISWAAGLETGMVEANANTISGPGIDGNAFSCISNGVSNDYYHVLIEQ